MIQSGGFNQTKSVTITVPMIPPSANALKRQYKNVHAYKSLRKEWERSIYYSIDHNPRYWLESMAKLGKKMRVEITIQHKKEYDRDNAWSACKVVFDALVNLKLLKDDSSEFCEQHMDQEKINATSTRICIREAEVLG